MSSSSDSEVMTMMLAHNGYSSWVERIRHAMERWQGAYSLIVLTRDGVFAVRDPWGVRPLSVGLLPSGGTAAASETGALRTLGCRAVREIKPGEIVSLSDNALVVTQAIQPKEPLARCVFEMIYFSRPDAVWDGKSVHQVRQNLGRELAREFPPQQTLSYQCRTHPLQPPSASQPSPASPITMALSRTAMSGGRSLSQPIRCASAGGGKV